MDNQHCLRGLSEDELEDALLGTSVTEVCFCCFFLDVCVCLVVNIGYSVVLFYFIYLSIHLFVYLSVYPSIVPSVLPDFVWLFVLLFIWLSLNVTHLSILSSFLSETCGS